MNELVELIRLLNLGKLRSAPVWEAIMEPGSLMEQLYDAIQAGTVHTEEEAMMLLYGSTAETAKFNSLKNKLRDRVVDCVFLLDYRDSGYSDRQKAYFECNKKWSAAVMLLSKNIKGVAIDILERLLKHTLHYEFTDLTLNILYNLRLHYGTIVGDPKKYEQAREQYNTQQKVWMMENEAEELYTHFVSHYVSNKATKEEMVEIANTYYEKIRPYMEASDSFRLHLCGRLLQTMVYTSQNDFQSCAGVCYDAINFFEQKQFESALPLQAFYYQLIVCYAQLREFKKGQEIIQRYQNLYEDGSYNWFKLQELFFLLALHTRHYDDAFTVYTLVHGHARFSSQPEVVRETWRIYEAYAYYLAYRGKLDQELTAKFKVNKFLGDVPKFSSDKRGMNIPILVAQMLFLLSGQDYHKAYDRIDALKRYCSRYLKKDDTFRSNCFIKMLLTIPEARFHREAVVRKSESLLEQLRSVPLELANQAHGIEIIPYEDLWEMTLELLGTQIITIKPRK